MFRSLWTQALVLAVSASTAFATPTLFCVDGPGGNNTTTIDLVNTGCISGDSNAYPDGGDGVYDDASGGDSEAKVEEAIFHATNTVVDIMLYGKSDDNPELFTFNPADPSTAQSGTWSVNDGTLIAYVTFKAANSYVLFQLATPSSSGTFDTEGIFNNGGQQPNLSHISLWTVPSGGTEIPEPATAALLLAGLAAVGARRRS